MSNRSMTPRIVALVVLGALGVVLFAIQIYKLSIPRAEEETSSLVSANLTLANGLAPISFEPTPARVERGKYLVEGPAHCFLCHSDVDWKKPGAPYIEEKKGAGHDWSDHGLSFLISPNLTPDKKTGSGNWTNEEFHRAIREGIGHDGRRLFPLMPYMHFRRMSDEDLVSVVSYIRSLRPVSNKLPTTALPDEIKESLPPHQPITEPVPPPDMSNPIERGAYLVTLANCTECHTPRDQKGTPNEALQFAGGSLLKGPWGEVASANITPDASGISYYDEEMFVQTIRTGQVKARKLNSIMPWGYFRNMTDDDLKAIFAYLRTMRPVQHRVDNTEPPTYCRLCGAQHGYGNRN